ncbi:MAG: class I SAM-dependent methyltransferase [Burkholderiaceae bacterium]
MSPDAYVEMARTEAQHWWFAGRRAILARMLRSLNLSPDARIFEIGSGTGGNLDMLAALGKVSAMELDEHARALAQDKTQGRYVISAGSCPENIAFSGERFDLVCMFDVLEHIEEDVATLRALHARLAPGGRVVLTVPAHPWLWSPHDVFLHHKRRYPKAELQEKIIACGFEIDKLSYFNMALFPVSVLVRLKDRVLGATQSSGTGLPPAPLNALMMQVFAVERHVLARMNLPFGLSLLCVCRPSKSFLPPG